MGNPDDRHPELLTQLIHQSEHLGLNGHIQRRGRLVGDEQAGIARDRNRDHHPLAHAPGKLVREVRQPALRSRNSDTAQQFHSPLPGLPPTHPEMGAQRFLDLEAHGQNRIEGSHRILEDEPDLAASNPSQILPAELKQVPALEHRFPGQDLGWRHGQQPQHGQHRRALAGTALAHNPEELAFPDLEADAVNRANITLAGSKPHRKVPDFKQRHRHSKSCIHPSLAAVAPPCAGLSLAEGS